MLPEQITELSLDKFSRCEEQTQTTAGGVSLNSIPKADGITKDAIYHAFWKDDVLRALEYDEINVQVKNAAVYLYGHIVSAASQSRVISALRTIPGILRIDNNLVLDDRLTLEVATSLGELEHTYACKFFTGASHGVISLNGIVSDENVKLLAEKCAAGHPQVRGVINNVQVSGAVLAAQGQPFLQPRIGETIYFLDDVSGVVKQVVIDPNHRRVIQIVIQGRLSSQKQNSTAQKNNQSQIPEKTVLIPIHLIRHLTVSSGFLTIKSTELTQYQDFNPLYFAAPSVDWTLPFPYCPGDVIFHVDVVELENQVMVDPDVKQMNISAQPSSPPAPAVQVDILANWEDDGGQTVQVAEAVS
jgi:osmotically-inducible protein OsmY